MFTLKFDSFSSSFNLIFIVITITDVPISPPHFAHLHPAPAPLPSGRDHTLACLWVMHLFNLFFF